jgi:TIGR00255 family protein
MIQSMTGFGKATAELDDKKITIEIKSLNSKQLDLNTRIAPIYREKEMEIRGELLQSLERGKVDLSIYLENIGKSSSTQINKPVFENYYSQIKEMATNLQIDLPADWFSVLLRLPDTIKTEIAELDETDWLKVQAALRTAVNSLIDFRKQEGQMLFALFEKKIGNIAALLNEIGQYEHERIERVKEKLMEAIQKNEITAFDNNRFEQELIFYIEKLDINEEKSRLKNHLDYFIKTLNDEKGQGKKLGFIVQEIGREINTMGSKSNHAEMQQIVVRMKDELEQIKEQVLNVL